MLEKSIYGHMLLNQLSINQKNVERINHRSIYLQRMRKRIRMLQGPNSVTLTIRKLSCNKLNSPWHCSVLSPAKESGRVVDVVEVFEDVVVGELLTLEERYPGGSP